MDTPSGYKTSQSGRSRGRGRKQAPHQPQLFDDTSTQSPYNEYGPTDYGGQPLSSNESYAAAAGNMQPGFPGGQILNDPVMANMAMQYGQNLADQGKDYVNKNLEKYVSTSKMKYYFAVDTSYVLKKLLILIFPFTHTDWSIKYNQDEPVAPRYEINAPDLYIPSMAFVTYILTAGVVLGIQNKFSPEVLGIQASSALVWLIIEMFVLLLSLYIMNAASQIKYLDLLAYCGYKYVGMILCLLGGLIFHSGGYYFLLLWTSITIAFFLVRSLKFQIVSPSHPDQYNSPRGGQRRLYLLLSIAFLQPVFMWWLTAHLIKF